MMQSALHTFCLECASALRQPFGGSMLFHELAVSACEALSDCISQTSHDDELVMRTDCRFDFVACDFVGEFVGATHGRLQVHALAGAHVVLVEKRREKRIELAEDDATNLIDSTLARSAFASLRHQESDRLSQDDRPVFVALFAGPVRLCLESTLKLPDRLEAVLHRSCLQTGIGTMLVAYAFLARKLDEQPDKVDPVLSHELFVFAGLDGIADGDKMHHPAPNVAGRFGVQSKPTTGRMRPDEVDARLVCWRLVVAHLELPAGGDQRIDFSLQRGKRLYQFPGALELEKRMEPARKFVLQSVSLRLSVGAFHCRTFHSTVLKDSGTEVPKIQVVMVCLG